MNNKVIINGSTKIISIATGVTNISVAIDLYSNWKEWVMIANNACFLPAFRAVGGDPLPGEQFLGSTYFLINGWKIRPQEANHNLSVVGNLYCEDGSSPFIPTLGNYNVIVTSTTSNIVQAVNISGSGVSASDIASEVWNSQIAGTNTTIKDFISKKLLTINKFIGLQ